MARYIGIDSAYRNTGIVILDESGLLLDRYVLKNTCEKEPEGLVWWSNQASKLFFPDDVVGIEGLSFGSIGRGHVLAASFAIWQMSAYLNASWMCLIPPMRAKKWATGDGHATKSKMIKWAKDALDLSKRSKISEHEADALALAQIARTAHRWSTDSQLQYRKAQREIIRNKKDTGVIQGPNKSYYECLGGKYDR